MKVLVLGASGMIGSTFFRVLAQTDNWDVFGTVRDSSVTKYFPDDIASRLIAGIDYKNTDFSEIIQQVQPDIVVNCVGLTKHISGSDDPLEVIPINALLPHQLNKHCEASNSRLIHISTDCVFLGTKGSYLETDPSDAQDIYGKSKYLGEVIDTSAVTIRTSTIGHELQTKNGLLEWFLSQQGTCKGYSKAIFSGLPTVILAEIVRDYVIPNKTLKGLYHVAGPAIDKYDLLKIIAKEYNKNIDIECDESFKIDRSLDANKFKEATGYVAPDWYNLINSMHNYNLVQDK